MTTIENKKQTRILYLDILRIFSIFAVIILHISVSFSIKMDPNNMSYWWAGNILNSMTRWCVPVLIIISGKLMLDNDKEEMIVPFLIKRVTKVIIPLVVWSFIYILMENDFNIQWKSISILSFLKKLYLGDVYIHLWYLYMVVGLYLITPIIKTYTKNANRNNLMYFITICFVVNGIIKFSEKFTGYNLAFDLDFFYWSIGYFVLGFILGTVNISKLQAKMIYFAGFLGLLATILGTYILTKHNNGDLVDHLYSYYAPNVIFTSIAVFLMGRRIDWSSLIKDNKTIKKIIGSLNKTSFGIYLIHFLVLEILSLGYFGITINLYKFNPLIGIILMSTIVFVISHFLVMIIQKIPLLRIATPK